MEEGVCDSHHHPLTSTLTMAGALTYTKQIHVEKKIKSQLLPDMVVHAFNPSSQETEAVGSLQVLGQFGLHSECQDSRAA